MIIDFASHLKINIEETEIITAHQEDMAIREKEKRGRYHENPEDKGDVVYNEHPAKCITISKQDFVPLMHNFIKHKDNKTWFPSQMTESHCV